VLDKIPGDALRAYVVWVPMNRALERDVPNATKEVWDPRARHYWDDGGWLMTAYKQVLGGYPLEPVWDTYIMYEPGATWDGDKPPKPAYWMHQLGSRSRPRALGPFWDPGEFSRRVGQLAR